MQRELPEDSMIPRPGHPVSSEINRYSVRAEKAGEMIKNFGKIRQQYDLDFDDVAILLACGRINFGSRKYQFSYVQAANVSSIADYIAMPRETVRRRLQILDTKRLMARVAHGYIVSDLAAWSCLTGNS